MPAIPIATLLSEATCYACAAPGDVPSLAKLALLSRIASGTSIPPIPPIGFNSLASFSSQSQILTSFTTAAYAPTPNALVLAFVFGSGGISSVSGNGLTWDLVQIIDTPSGNIKHCSIYRAMGAAPTNTGFTFNTSISVSGVIIHVQEYTNVKQTGANGADAIYQSVAVRNANSVTIAPLNPNGLNVSVGVCVSNDSPATPVLESGWTQDLNQTQVPSSSISAFIAHKLASTDASFTTSMTGVSTVAALEVVSANSSAPAIIQPSAIANLEIWVRSDTGVYQDAGKAVPCTNGTPLFTWDNMGNTAVVADFVQATLGSRPTYNTGGGINGKPRISFSSSKMTLTSGTFAQPFTLIILANYTGNVGTFGTYFWSSDSGIEIGVDATTLNEPFVYAGVGRRGSIPITSTPSLQAYTVNGATSSVLINTIYCLEAGSVGAGALNVSLNIGGNVASTLFLIGDIYEVFMISRAATPAEMCQIQIYAKDRYGLPY